MIKYYILLSVLFLSSCSIFDSNENERVKEIITNGSFEDSLKFWNANSPLISLNDEYTFDGNHSLYISTSLRDVAYVYQFLDKPVIQLDSKFKVFPASENYNQAIQFVANWNPSAIGTIWIIQISMTPRSIMCKSLDSLYTFPSTLKLNEWNTIDIQSLSTGEINVFINDTLKSSFKNTDLIHFETLMLGDLTWRMQQGAFYYDNISVKTKE